MFDLPTKPKVEIQRCSQAHFEKIFTPLKNDSESIYKKLEELEFREVPDTDHYYDESIEVVNGLDDELNVYNQDNLHCLLKMFRSLLPHIRLPAIWRLKSFSLHSHHGQLL